MRKRILILCAVLLMAVTGLVAQEIKNTLYFDISPNPMDRQATISVAMENEAGITLTVETESGEIVRTIFSGLVNKNASFLWERDDDGGNFVAAGTYTVVLRYNSRYTSTKKTLILK